MLKDSRLGVFLLCVSWYWIGVVCFLCWMEAWMLPIFAVPKLDIKHVGKTSVAPG